MGGGGGGGESDEFMHFMYIISNWCNVETLLKPEVSFVNPVSECCEPHDWSVCEWMSKLEDLYKQYAKRRVS